ncbi:hypothetical protein PHJA_002177300 [Phtheirospermum japonicum]|uniref:DUF668 domain-containing protein n=1 Tax=Phtheirospermum japonicum TaxID=374723 RepID=A0A830CQ28_9LAMI|nr:hypothetical protein PHJA_002177300 [Phtheirospermum japonicum]
MEEYHVYFVLEMGNSTMDYSQTQKGEMLKKGIICNQHRLGPARLALHYANIILQIDSIVSNLCTDRISYKIVLNLVLEHVIIACTFLQLCPMSRLGPLDLYQPPPSCPE